MGSKPNADKWRESNESILRQLDIQAEYEALGVRIANRQPSASGWLSVHAVGREDNNPSAAINVGDGPVRGRYRDMGGEGLSLNLFDFAAKFGSGFGGDWREARRHFARKAGVKLPSGEEKLAIDKLDFVGFSIAAVSTWCEKKLGITMQAVKACGGVVARWPKNLAAEHTHYVIAFPSYGPALLDSDPKAYVIVNSTGGKLRLFQGKGNEPKLEDKLTLGGDYEKTGLIGLDGLRRLTEAKVVWKTEGLSDLLALQSILPPDCPDVVVTNACGASEIPQAGWLEHFAGKDVRIVHDADTPGQTGAEVWMKAVAQIAEVTRNVRLPYTIEEKHGKDARDWIVEGHGYADLCELAAQAPAIRSGTPEAEAVGLGPTEAILKKLRIVVLGEHEGSQKVEVFSEALRKTTTIGDIDRLSYSKMIQAFGAEAVKEHVDRSNEVAPGKHSVYSVRDAIAEVASGKRMEEQQMLGLGVWAAGNGSRGQILIVNAGEFAVWKPTGELEQCYTPVYGGKLIDLGAPEPWYDFDELQSLLEKAGDLKWCQDVFDEATQLFVRWNWRYGDTPPLVAALVCASWVQTLWEWRPQVAITGPSDCGKSTLMGGLLQGLFVSREEHGMSLYVEKPTEAAVRQHLKHHAFVMKLDEFEQDSHRQKILELFRVSSRGGTVIRGTSNQKGSRYTIRHIPWMGAIETGMKRQADRNRYIVLEALSLDPDVRGKITLPRHDRLRELGLKLLAVAVRRYHEAQRLSTILKTEQVPEVPGRVVESYSVPIGLMAAVFGEVDDDARKSLHAFLRSRDFGSQRSRDEEDLIEEILTSEVFMDGGKRQTVGQLLQAEESQGFSDPDTDSALCRVGIRKVTKRSKRSVPDLEGCEYLFVCHDVVRRQLLKRDGDFAHLSIDQILLRVKGAERDRQRLGGVGLTRGVSIPINKIRNSDPTDEDQADHEKSLF